MCRGDGWADERRDERQRPASSLFNSLWKHSDTSCHVIDHHLAAERLHMFAEGSIKRVCERRVSRA
jgi:hypothetical protein